MGAVPTRLLPGWNGNEKFYAGASWLQYLIDHFLRRGAEAQGSGDPQFTEFSFDHEMKGVIVGEQQDSRELLLLRVEQDQVTKQILRRGRPCSSGFSGHRERRNQTGSRAAVLDERTSSQPLVTVRPLQCCWLRGSEEGSGFQRAIRAPSERSDRSNQRVCTMCVWRG